jgi:hypothetical protein
MVFSDHSCSFGNFLRNLIVLLGSLVIVSAALADEHLALIPASADTVVLSGAWGAESQQAYGVSTLLPAAADATRRSEVLLKFPVSGLMAAPRLRIARARLELTLAAQEPTTAALRLDVYPLAPESVGWDERSLTSKDWWSRRNARSQIAEEPSGSVTISPSSSFPTSCVISLSPSAIESQMRGPAAEAGFSIRLNAGNGAGAAYVISREVQLGQYAPRLFVWYEGDYAHALDPAFRPWDSA